jgi:hypothetical protein
VANIAGAASNCVLDKVGTLTPGKEADIIEVVYCQGKLAGWNVDALMGRSSRPATAASRGHWAFVLCASKKSKI